jgi:hypothetical protein
VDIITQIRKLVREEQVLFSAKANRQFQEEPWEYEDFVHSVMKGKIHKKQKDEKKESGYKYTLIGPALDGSLLYSTGKIVQDHGRAYFVITFHGAQ